MNEMQSFEQNVEPVRTAAIVGAEIRNLTRTVKQLNVLYAVEVGRRLTEAKAMVGHGEWMDWLKRETEFSQSAANRLMRVYAEYGADQNSIFGAETKSSTLNNLSVSNALRLLAVPEEERETFAAEVDAEHLSSGGGGESRRGRCRTGRRGRRPLRGKAPGCGGTYPGSRAGAGRREERGGGRGSLQKPRPACGG